MTASVGAAPTAGAPTLAAHAAVAPVDHFIIAAGVNADPIDYGDGTRHVAGELAFGAFAVGDPRLRAEVLAGVGGGYGTGEWNGEDGDEGLEGPYVRPFVQGTIAGFWAGFFTWGGGLRLATTVVDLTVIPIDPGSDRATPGLNAQVHIDPFTTARFRADFFEVDLTVGGSLSFGERTVGPMGNVYATVGLRLRFQAWGEPTPEPEPELLYQPPPGPFDDPGETAPPERDATAPLGDPS